MIETFKKGLDRRDMEEIRKTTYDDLKESIASLQARHHSQRRLQDFSRLESFLEAIEQYGSVITGLFYQGDDLLAFVWGPLKILLKQTSMTEKAFCELLNAYQNLGENLPRLLQYKDVLSSMTHMIGVLVSLYEDLLEFQQILLRYFKQLQWQRVFDESWNTCRTRCSSIVIRIARRRSLIESQASPPQIEEVRDSIQQDRENEDREVHQHDLKRTRDVFNWLKPTNVDIDQDTFIQARADYPNTGHWLLEDSAFKDWFDPRYVTIPPLLWLNGIPGAGKTILASLVVQKARELDPAPIVLFYYFKHGDPDRDNFVSLGRSLLAQFLRHDNELLPTLYEKSCRDVEATLTSSTLIEELLNLAFDNCKSAYIILDGLDECPRDQRKFIAQWFRNLVENLPSDAPDRLRCLFVSQDDGAARKDFAGLASIKIDAEDNQSDIEQYSRIEADKLHRQHPDLSEEKLNWIASIVANSAKGQFLLAKLRWINLSGHTSIARLEEELDPNVFPREVHDVYRRIMVRINESAPGTAMKDILRLLGWLVCAKRPLKWHEIQCMNSINLYERRVDFEHQRFIKSPKELLASLVELRPDGALELVHSTATYFLLEEKHIDPLANEIGLANLCIDYLNMPAFVEPPSEEGVLNGDYGFMDYAVLFWLRHLEAGATLKADETELMDPLAESLDIFIAQHWKSPAVEFTLAKRHSDKLKSFEARPFYGQLEQAVASTKKQLKYFGKLRDGEVALDLAHVVARVRECMEAMASNELQPSTREKIEQRYGTNIFKCPRFSCHFFTTGFASASERDKHISKHDRPFQCSEENCVMHTLGFSSEAERDRHMRENHLSSPFHDEDFPTDQDVERSILDHQIAEDSAPTMDGFHDQQGNTQEVVGVEQEQEQHQLEPEVNASYQQRQKRQRQTEFKCDNCSQVYKKRYNLQSHLRTHGVERPYPCAHCDKEFARSGDWKRHMKTHTGEKSFDCHGSLRDGRTWGCGKSFSRADILRKHWESRRGRECRQAFVEEEEPNCQLPNQPIIQTPGEQRDDPDNLAG
ncbi:uncharacterized protein E0L32_001720 [Thyridium curvatum]|uniref:Uncharacterized protein n=1 Tax=Thyridium curvatum TaxID=1093900 RepID=A0A507AVP6_9PEZI|nr:uncharacterized protein E0L32_001479 [Thyridium curvatum]XP_030990971.1 uncharacterized protein E0L32_001720 [Thyridium curvatum]TPX09019.1 hypothetical protein E0L32_001479 [Thyridium curvatum]TPX09260.1 hypothetical protein E0L32_001720 [Thyridium curvatum]